MALGFYHGARAASWGRAAGVMLLTMTTWAMAQPQPPTQRSAGELLQAIERLQVVGSVLYVAAHPDDENTRLLAYLVGQRGLRVGYLSMTRGGGGQNLIGPEQADLLGVVRTGELLAARRVDGAEQFFSRFRDFGYSKSPEETLTLWGHAEARSDVVQVFRRFRPDVVITRFAPTGRNHGHHTASAILAAEAFEAAAKAGGPGGEPWQVDRLLHNKSHWRIKPGDDTSQWVSLDVGTYDPRLGLSYGEVAGHSRTMHKSQGFGSAPVAGPQLEYFEAIAGTPVAPTQDLLHGLNLTWARFEGTEALQAVLARAAREFDPRAPQAVLPLLAEADALMAKVPDAHWRDLKRAELAQVMLDCAGFHLEARAEQPAVVPGQAFEANLRVLMRTPAKARLLRAGLVGGGWLKGSGFMTPGNDWALAARPGREPAALSRPFWLAGVPTPYRYALPKDAELLADEPGQVRARFVIEIEGRALTIERPVEHVWTDPVQGQRAHPLEVLPPVTATFDRAGLMLPHGEPADVRLTLRASTDAGATGALTLTAPAGYTVAPATVDFALTQAQPEQVVSIKVTAAAGAEPGALSAVATVGGTAWSWQRAVIDYPHLPRRTVLRPATLQLSPLALVRGEGRIGYLAGSGDTVADSLRAVGYAVDDLSVDAIVDGALSRYAAVVMGIRAYNKHPRLLALHPQLMAYVANGGRLIVQYNTNNRFNPLDGPVGPYPFHISRERVTDETAELVPVDPKDPLMMRPNRLTGKDFSGWVQERGLYFADTWDDRYQPVWRAHDAGEAPLAGSTLVARHGKGVFVYTGLSFFRQLPAGVPGAYRLFANLLALPATDR